MTDNTAYAAGIFDGEGCVYVVGGDGQVWTHGLRVKVAMCDPEPIKYLYDNYGGTIRNYMPRDGRGKRVVFIWNTATHDSLAFLEAIEPYVLGKRTQLLIALEFPIGGGPGTSISPDVRLERQYIKEELVRLKEPRYD